MHKIIRSYLLLNCFCVISENDMHFDRLYLTILGGIVDHHTARRRGLGCKLFGDGGAGGKQADWCLRKIEISKILHGDIAVAKLDLLASGSTAGQWEHLIYREVSFRQNGQHGFAHRAGGANHRNIIFLAHDLLYLKMKLRIMTRR